MNAFLCNLHKQLQLDLYCVPKFTVYSLYDHAQQH